jgi:hypothetical protein
MNKEIRSVVVPTTHYENCILSGKYKYKMVQVHSGAHRAPYTFDLQSFRLMAHTVRHYTLLRVAKMATLRYSNVKYFFK